MGHMQQVHNKPFGGIRNFLWPIHNHELRKLIPIFTLFFLISFIYNVLRCMKLSLIVTAENSGAEAIPFLKVWAVLPGAIIITYFFTKLASRYKREHVFYIMVGFFLSFFVLFTLVLYPNREALELKSLASFLQAHLPEGFKGLIAIMRHWTLTLFYVLSELWGTVVLAMLFWGFANEVTNVDEAKRFYAIFALGANASGFFSGQFSQWFVVDTYTPWIPFGSTAWEQSLFLLLSTIVVCGIVILSLFRWLNVAIIQKETSVEKLWNVMHDEPKHFSLRECFSFLARSKYLRYIAIIVVTYNIVYNLTDVLWTDQVKQRYPATQDFNNYMNQVTSYTGIVASIFALIISGNVIRRYGWTAAAMITPLIWLMGSVGFFGCLLLEHTTMADVFYGIFGSQLTTLTVLVGGIQLCFGRASKYTVFDETKEIAFIPLPKADQRKGKAVVDGIASRFGKSGGSIMYQALLVICVELARTIPYVAIIILVSALIWISAVLALGKLVKRSVDQELQPVEEESLAPVTVERSSPVSGTMMGTLSAQH